MAIRIFLHGKNGFWDLLLAIALEIPRLKYNQQATKDDPAGLIKVIHRQVHILRIHEIARLLLQGILSGHLHLMRNRRLKEGH